MCGARVCAVRRRRSIRAAAPIVADGVAYISTGANDVFALSIDSGDILWQQKPSSTEHHLRLLRLEQQGRRDQRGRVFIGQLDGKLLALDRKSGKVAWSIQAERWQENFSITAAPLR